VIATLQRNLITDPGDMPEEIEWVIWLQLEPGDPEYQHESFIIGEGRSLRVARLEALTQLRQVVQTILAFSELTRRN